MAMDTIAAVATPLGEGGIAVIRVSGPEALAIVDQVYTGKSALIAVPSHTIHYGFILHPQTREKLDEVLVTVMKAPRTFTREDVVEVSCHGGMIPVQAVLEAILASGARLAEPGEFTKRAFLNGRIDLSQAEAVIDLIRSKTDLAASVAMQQSEGRLKRHINQLRQMIVETLAHLAVNVDYPEYDAEEMTAELIRERCEQMSGELERLLATARQGKILREGITTAIIGKPNVGKSSLLNALAQEAKAIVTNIPGTTRDVIEEQINVRGIPLRLLDTAGIRETEDVVEKIGVERSEAAIQTAELILYMLSYNQPLDEMDRERLASLRDKNVIVIVNKLDLPQELDLAHLRDLSTHPVVCMSLLEDKGIDDLEEVLSRLFFQGKINRADLTYVSNARHIHLLEQARGHVLQVLSGIEMGVPLDVVEIDLKNAWEDLGEVIGEAISEDLIDQIFSQFCLGK